MYSFDSGALVEVYAGGTIDIAGDGGGTLSANNARVDWGDGSYPVTWYTDGVYLWSGAVPNTSNITYFPNAGTEIPIFWNAQPLNIGAGGANPTVFNGLFRSSVNLTIQNTALKTFRNGIQIDAGVVLTQNLNSGAFVISGTATINMGAGASILLSAAGMNVASTSMTTLTSAITVNGTGPFSVASGGTLELENFIVSGTAPFTLNSGGVLKIGHTQGIASSGSTGNIQTTGTRTFNAGGTYEYYGINGQQITGTGLPTTINTTGKILINNADHVVQSTNYTVNGALELANGCLITNQQIMTIGAGATLAYSSTSFVCTCLANGFSPASLGGLTRTAGTAFFPVGPETTVYMPATINNSGTSDQFNVRVEHLNASNVNPYATEYFIQRQWIITESIAGGTDATIELQWASGEEGALFDPATNPFIGRWNGSSLEKLSGTYDAGDPSVSASPFSAFSPFVVGSSAALPTGLIAFTANPRDGSTDLAWATATEINNAFFVVERSADGVYFEDIAEVPGAGNSSLTQHYTYTDHSPNNGPNYYRLRITGFDGSYALGPVRSVFFSRAGTVHVQPVPATEMLHVLLHEVPSENIAWSIYNQSGRLVLYGEATETTAPFEVHVRTLPPGVYFLRTTAGHVTYSTRFSKL